MGTKRDGDGCYERAKDDEPMFVLLARDPHAPYLVEQWAFKRLDDIVRGDRPHSDLPQAIEAMRSVQKMKDWRFANWPH